MTGRFASASWLKTGRGHFMKTLLLLLVCTACFTERSTVVAQCKADSTLRSQEPSTFAAPEYTRQIQLARRAALRIYDQEMRGNLDSAIKDKLARPPGISVAVTVDNKLVWAEGFGFADVEQCVPVVPK